MTETAPVKIYNSDLRLSDGINDYHIYNHLVMPGPDEKRMSLAGKSDAASFVSRCMGFMHDDQSIRDFLKNRNIRCKNINSTREMADCVASEISSTPLIVVPINKVSKGGGHVPDPIDEKPLGMDWAFSLPFFKRKRIRFKFVDEGSTRSIKSVAVRVTSSDGSFKEMLSNSAGEITWNNLKSGPCKLSCDFSEKWGPTVENTLALTENGITSIAGTEPIPVDDPKDDKTKRKPRYYLSKIKEHRVAEGETLKSIAEENNMTFADLAYFNWGVYDNATVLQCMSRDTGCTRLTKDKKDCQFSGSDSPGILFIPEPLAEEDFATGQTHIIKVSAVGFAQFYEPFQVTILDDENKPLEKIQCELKHPNGTISMRETDQNGVISLSGINAKKTKVRVVDYDSFEITKG